MHTNIFRLFMVVLLAMLVTGCSSDSSNPMAPVNEDNVENDGVPIIGLSHADDMINGVGIMGSYDFYLNPETLEVEMTQSRKVSIGEDFIVSGMAYWTIVPCGDCLKVDGIVPDGDYFKVTFEIRHPFEPGNPLEPPSGKNRLDLDIFDAALVIAPNGATSDLYHLTNCYVYTDFCAMADGYTPELANLTGDPAVLPYYLVVDDSDSGVSTWNEFPMGEVDSFFDVYFDTGGRFRLFLTFGYGVSATFHTRFEPKYYNPEFNRKAAWKVDVTPPQGSDPPSMANTWNNLDTTTLFDVTVEVYDWQIGATVYGDPLNFGDAPTDNIFAASGVSAVTVEIPGMFAPVKVMDTADQGSGAPGDPLIYNFSIANENGIDAGTYNGLVLVLDERLPLTELEMRDFLVHSPLGTDRYNYIIPEYATYQIFPAVVVGGCGPIIGTIDTPVCPLTGVLDDAMINFSATASSANGGEPIVLYEWDMDYDGVTFDVDATGSSAILGPFDNPSCDTPTPEPLDYIIAVRATDSCTPPNITIFDECTITVDNCDSRPIYSLNFVAKPAADFWWDVCVAPDADVYVCADHDATGNVDGDCDTGLRTALRFDNDLTNMEVMNETEGIAEHINSWEWVTDWQRLDVSIGGSLITSQCGSSLGTWSVAGTTATSEACCWVLQCGASPPSEIPDVADHISAGYGSGVIGFGKIHEDCDPETDWALAFSDTDLTTYSGNNSSGVNDYPSADFITNVVGLEGIDDTDNIMVFYSSGTDGKISIWGDAYSESGTATELDFAGVVGTGPGEFTGGLDFSIDSEGFIVTVEDNGGVYRFQKFTYDLVFMYEHEWDGSDAPMRIDFDKGDNTLYMLTDDGVHVLYVN